MMVDKSEAHCKYDRVVGVGPVKLCISMGGSAMRRGMEAATALST
jgi:hypothetical protein